MKFRRILFALAVGAAIVVGGTKPDALFALRILSLVSASSGSAAVTNLQFSSFELSPSNTLVFGAEWPADTYFPDGGISVWTTGRIDMPSWRRFPQLVPVVSGASGMTFEMPRPLQLGGASSGFYRLAGDNYPTPSPPGDGGPIVGEPPRDWRARYGLDPFRSIGGEDPDGDGKSNHEEYCEGTDPTDAASCGYQLPTTNTLSLAVSIGSDAAAWELEIKGNGPDDFGVRRLAMPKDLMWLTNTYEFCKGNSYTLTLHWINNDRLKNAGNAKCPWHCWEARVDGKPNVRTRENWTLERIPDIEEFIAGEGYIIDNRDGLLTDHVHKNSTNGVCEVHKDISATLYIEPFIEMTIDGGKEGVVLFHEEYTNTPREIVSSATTVAKLVAKNFTTAPGEMILDCVSSKTNKFSISDADGRAIALPHTWFDNGDQNEHVFYLSGLKHSDSENDIVLKLSYNDNHCVVATIVALTVVETYFQAEAIFPQNNIRSVFGPLEDVECLQIPETPRVSVIASCNDVLIQYINNHACLIVPMEPGRYVVNWKCKNALLDDSVSVVSPTGVVAEVARPASAGLLGKYGLRPFAQGHPGAAMEIKLRVVPDTVCFSKIKIFEGYAPVDETEGYYSCASIFPAGSLDHGYDCGAVSNYMDDASAICEDCNRMFGFDLAAVWMSPRSSYVDGSFSFVIPIRWYASPRMQPLLFHHERQKSCVYSDGSMRVEKYGYFLRRSLSCDINYDEVGNDN